MKRRSFLGAMAAAPFAGKAAAEQVLQQTGIGMNVGYGAMAGRGEQGASAAGRLVGNKAGMPMHELWRQAAKRFPGMLAEQESLMFEEERHVSFIDPDIAACRSFSMAAKIAYQRQRNVAAKLKRLQDAPPWERYDSITKRLNSLIGD